MGWLFTIHGLIGLQYLTVALCTIFFLPVDFLAIFLETTKDIILFNPFILLGVYWCKRIWKSETRAVVPFLKSIW